MGTWVFFLIFGLLLILLARRLIRWERRMYERIYPWAATFWPYDETVDRPTSTFASYPLLVNIGVWGARVSGAALMGLSIYKLVIAS